MDQAKAPDLITYVRAGDRLIATVADRPENPEAGEAMVFELSLTQAVDAPCPD